MKKYRVRFHTLPEGSVITGAKSRKTIIEAASEERAVAELMEAYPGARVSDVEEVAVDAKP